MAKGFLFFVFTASTGSLASTGGPEDADVLVQAQLSTDKADVPQDIACRCLSWKDVFTNGRYNMSCGDGPAELVWTRRTGNLPPNNRTKDSICKLFLHRLNLTACINYRYGSPNKDQWCFVEASCRKATLISGKSKAKVAYRMCEAGKDTLLREQSPLVVHQFAKESRVDPAMLIKWAYPITGALEGTVRWPGIKEAMGLKKPAKGSNVAESKRVLQQVKTSKQTMIFESDEQRYGQPPFGLIWGNTTWEVTRPIFMAANAEDLLNLWLEQTSVQKVI